MKWFQGMVAAVTASITLLSAVNASARHRTCCACQQKVCYLEVDQEEVEVDCFEVEHQDVCVPPVRFWWECGPIERCGYVRTVHKLTTNSYTKTECAYDWSVKTICCRCYDKVHRLRCHQLGLSPDATPEQVGLPNREPLTDTESREIVGFQIPQPPRAEGPAVVGSREWQGMLTGETPVHVADVPALEP